MDAPAMAQPLRMSSPQPPTIQWVAIESLHPSPFSHHLYGPAENELDGLQESIERQGILVPLVIAPRPSGGWEVLSGHRRLACAKRLGWPQVRCEISDLTPGNQRALAILEFNRHREKSFSQRMREAEALEELLTKPARSRSLLNLKNATRDGPDRLNSDDRRGRTDQRIARAINLGGKDLYRQARAIWDAYRREDIRAIAAVAQLDAGTKTIHAAHKDLRRRDRFTTQFRPTPYDIWSFRHDDGFGIPHPGAIPASIIAHTVHYFCPPDGLVVDPMAGGGTTLDVCHSMGRRCLAYDLHPTRDDILFNDILQGLPDSTRDCDLLFCDPPYHSMKAGSYPGPGVGEEPLSGWIAFLQDFAGIAFSQLRPGGHVALLLANQTERDLPVGYGYLDHAFLGYDALRQAGFQPIRRISCPMSGGYQPQQIRQARLEGRLLGLVRDLLIMRKPDRPLMSQAYHASGSPPTSS